MVSLVCEGDRDCVFSLWRGQGMVSLVCEGDKGWCL